MTSWFQNPAEKVCEASRNLAFERQQQLTKPLGSLGRLEQLAIDFAGFQRTEKPRLDNVSITIFAADHGVVAEGVSIFPQAVTADMIRNFSSGGAAICVLAKQCRADFSVLNLGTVTPLENLPSVNNQRINNSTQNFCNEPAMSEQELHQALQAGRDSIPEYCQLFIGGEMGIGNTTSAAAIYCALLELNVDETVGRGTGVDDAGLLRKKQVVQRGLQRHIKDDSTAVDVLRCLGGFEIVALVGAYIACAQRGVPVMVDGYITTAAALAACQINPSVRDWLLFSHSSAESAHRRVLSLLDAEPLVDLGMRLGEGSGAALVVPLLQSALKLHSEMATFAEAGVSIE